MSMRWSVLALGLMLLPTTADALTFRQDEFVCPIDGKAFTATVMTSGTSFGAYFDGQLIGPIMSPGPLLTCPGNGFIIDRPDGYSEAELAKLRPFVASDEYRGWVAKESQYWRLARQRAFLGEDPDSIAYALLQATWEAGGEQYDRYAAEAVDALQQQAKREVDQGKEAVGARMLVGELQRRLGRFDDARATFAGLRADPAFPGEGDDRAKTYRRQVLEAQLQLIEARDSGRARLDDDGKIARF